MVGRDFYETFELSFKKRWWWWWWWWWWWRGKNVRWILSEIGLIEVTMWIKKRWGERHSGEKYLDIENDSKIFFKGGRREEAVRQKTKKEGKWEKVCRWMDETFMCYSNKFWEKVVVVVVVMRGKRKCGGETWEMKRLRLEKDTRRGSNISTKETYVHPCIKVLYMPILKNQTCICITYVTIHALWAAALGTAIMALCPTPTVSSRQYNRYKSKPLSA